MEPRGLYIVVLALALVFVAYAALASVTTTTGTLGPPTPTTAAPTVATDSTQATTPTEATTGAYASGGGRVIQVAPTFWASYRFILRAFLGGFSPRI